MNGSYGEVAVVATTLALRGMAPAQAWVTAAKQAFPSSPSAQRKGCPRSTYLSLVGSGELRNLAPGEYTKAIENRQYAEKALRLLRAGEGSATNPSTLWAQVLDGLSKQHNGQMSVVLGLWRANLFVGQNP